MLGLTMLLGACSNVPVSLSVPDASFPMVSLPTGSFVLFYKEPLPINRPLITPKSVAIEGIAEYQQTDLQVDVYGSLKLPLDNCAEIPQSPFLLCEAKAYIKLTKTPVSFAGGVQQNFRLEGDMLSQAVNQSKIWLGAQITAGSPSSGTMFLKNMTAKVSVL